MKPMTEEYLKRAESEVDDRCVFSDDQITYLHGMIFQISQAIENEASTPKGET